MKFSTIKSTEDKNDINMDESELLEVEQQPKSSKSFFSRKSKKNKDTEEDVEEETEEVVEEVVEKPKKKGFFKKSKKIKEPKDEKDVADEVEEEEAEEVEKVEKSKNSFFRRNNKDKSVVEVEDIAEDNDEKEEVEEPEDAPKKKKMFSLPKIKKGKKEKEEELIPNDEEQHEEEETEEKSDKKKSFFKLGSKKKDLIEEPVAEEEVENHDTPKDETDELGKKKKFFSFKKKTPTKKAEPQTDEPQVGLYDTEAVSKSIDSVENKIIFQSSQDEVREHFEPEQPVESIVSPDRSSQHEPLPAHDIPLPPSAVKQTACMDGASVEDVTPASPKADDKSLEDVALSMDKPLSPRSDAPSGDISSPKAQSIAEAQFEDKLVEGADTADEKIADEETPVTTTEDTEVGDSSLSKKISEICGSDAEIATTEKSTDDTQNTGMFCGFFSP